MQQTSLNLIAIGIFAMTLSCLLGPMFNISPAIPAIATFGILSLTTLDTLSLQGKGVTLLLDSVARTSPQYRARIVQHEAGHFLVAYLLEISVIGYTLSAWEAFKQGKPGQGGVEFASQELSTPMAAIAIQRYCTVLMAGIAAETLVYGSAEGGLEDRQKLQTFLTALGRHSSDFLQQERFYILQAKTLLEKHLPAYQALVMAMEQRTPVVECCEAIDTLTVGNED